MILNATAIEPIVVADTIRCLLEDLSYPIPYTPPPPLPPNPPNPLSKGVDLQFFISSGPQPYFSNLIPGELKTLTKGLYSFTFTVFSAIEEVLDIYGFLLSTISVNASQVYGFASITTDSQTPVDLTSSFTILIKLDIDDKVTFNVKSLVNNIEFRVQGGANYSNLVIQYLL